MLPHPAVMVSRRKASGKEQPSSRTLAFSNKQLKSKEEHEVDTSEVQT